MILLNETEWAEAMIQARTLGRKPYETLYRVARYFIDQNGYTKKEVRKALEDFIVQCEPNASIPKWSNTIDYAITHATKYKTIEIDSIPVTASEMKRIDSLGSRQLRRLAFTLLCLSRYFDIVNGTPSHWVNCKDSEIMKMANINTSIRRQSLMYHLLNQNGMIQFSKKISNTNVCVTFQSDDEPVMHITDMRNLGYQYLKYHGEAYSTCENCGLTFKTNNIGRPRRYCNDCSNMIKVQRAVNSAMKIKKFA